MHNELLLILSVLLIYGGVFIFYYIFRAQGLYCWTVLATVAANIEVLIVIRAFGMEQTLGNIMFASTFLVTDILSETCSKEEAERAVNLGIMTSLAFILISQLWLAYTPADTDWAMPSIAAIFSNTPRLMLTSFAVYAVCQKFDVWAYHKWWEFTQKRYGDSRRFLWLRNNGSTMISQMLNSLLFTFGAFWGVHSLPTLISIFLSSYVIFVFTSILDTPVIYLARRVHESK